MFKNVGEKIKVFSVIFFILILLGALVGAIVIWSQRYMDAKFFIGLGTLAGGFFVAIFSALCIQGYGIIVSSYESQEIPAIAEKKPTDYNGNLFNDMDKNNAIKKAPKSVPANGEWKCPKCGKINQNYVGTCGCGEVKPK